MLAEEASRDVIPVAAGRTERVQSDVDEAIDLVYSACKPYTVLDYPVVVFLAH